MDTPRALDTSMHDLPRSPTHEAASGVSRLVTEYFLRTDRPEFGCVADLFDPQGVLELGPLKIEGRDAIAAFFAERNPAQAASRRLTRHSCGPVALRATSTAAVMEAHSTVIVFAGVGAVPLPSEPPSSIADFDDVCARDEHGEWRFLSRKATILFLGANPPVFAK